MLSKHGLKRLDLIVVRAPHATAVHLARAANAQEPDALLLKRRQAGWSNTSAKLIVEVGSLIILSA